eukprot:CAMPEP_0174296086 /NCGR_PEP_ID=MMETSP0809-20121228/46828_1 /TAXON_ID=73025 ORGANISM="Eutreptiella gymnastica-like, Strain CCMP1594" /NCGR_SAMPLE_ID=MMETSP0809 /ASSEMBLY_ACC=CAM_ASM_000658 /LENGTH=31 /DNA_ID= /DNA_START= /DNA_END= /DNA_ORIENTATION=
MSRGLVRCAAEPEGPGLQLRPDGDARPCAYA